MKFIFEFLSSNFSEILFDNFYKYYIFFKNTNFLHVYMYIDVINKITEW